MSMPLLQQRFVGRTAEGSEIELMASGNASSAIVQNKDGAVMQRVLRGARFAWIAAGEAGEAAAPRPRGGPRAAAPLQPGAAAAYSGNLNMVENLPKPRWQNRIDNQRAQSLQQVLSRGAIKAPPKRLTRGNFVGLCLLIQFPDLPAVITQDQVNDFCNQTGYNGFANNGSVRDYFHEISQGLLNYSTEVLPCYTAAHTRDYYTDETQPYAERARELITEALQFYLAAGVNFGGLSSDPQNCVYALNVLYAGGEGEWGKGLWPHASRLTIPVTLANQKNVVDYQISAMNNKLTLGVYCHENGHMLCDFPDLYAYPETRQKIGVGNYCLMCTGARATEQNPTHVCAYLKYRAGWGRVTAIVNGLNSLPDADPNVFLIHQRSDTEYFIIESRRNQGRDSALMSSGLAIWHIDELGSNASPEQAPDGHQHAECVLLQADGRGELQANINFGDATDLFGPEPNPVFVDGTELSSRWWDGTPSGLQIRAIESANGAVQFIASMA